MRADRLVAILLLLQRHGKRTAPQLAKDLEVSERTILRDIAALSMSGVPVYAERGPQGGFRLVEGYRLNLTGLRSPEVRTLFLRGIDGVLSDLGWHQDAQTARDKLACAVSEEQKSAAIQVSQRFFIDETRWFSTDNPTPFLQPLQDAIWGNLRLDVSYKNPHGTILSRVVSPLALVAKAGVWYLVADRDNQLRVYRVSRITHVELLDEHFERPESFNLERLWNAWTKEFMSSLPKYMVLLWIESGAHETFVQRTPFPIESGESDAPDGYITARVTYETMEMACAHILGYNFKVYVVDPPELRTLVIERSRQTLGLYEHFHHDPRQV